MIFKESLSYIKRFILLAVALSLVVDPAFSDVPVHLGKGPVSLENQYIPIALHAGWRMESPETAEAGEISYRSSFAISNTNIKESTYQVDAETRNSYFEFDYGLSDNWEAGVRFPLLWRGGGFLDPAIDQWHDTFGLPQGARDSVNDNEFLVRGEKTDGQQFNLKKKGWRSGNLVLKTKYNIIQAEQGEWWPWMTLKAEFSLPTASEEFGHDGVDYILGWITGKRLYDNIIWYGGSSLIFYSDKEVMKIRYPRVHLEGFNSVEYEISDKWSILGGIFWSASSLASLPEHPNTWAYLDLQAKYQINPGVFIEGLIRENIIGGEGTTDIDFLLGLVIKTF